MTIRWYPPALSSVIVAVVLAAMGLFVAAPAPAHAETGGAIYVIDRDCCGTSAGAVIRVDPATGVQTVISFGQNFINPRDVVLGTNGLLYVLDQNCCFAGIGSGGVIQVNPSLPNGSNQTVISSGQNFRSPISVALDTNGMLYVTDVFCCGDLAAVIQVNPNLPNGLNQFIISSGIILSSPLDVVLGLDGQLYVVDSSGAIIRVNPTQPNGGNQTIVSSGQSFSQPTAAAFGADGKLYVADRAVGVIRVDLAQPSNANQTIVSTGQNFQAPVGIALAPDSKLYVIDAECCTDDHGAVIRVNQDGPVGNNQTIISSGQSFDIPVSLAVLPALSVANQTVTEGTGTVPPTVATVVLSPLSMLPLTVRFATAAGTATAGADFAPSSGTLIFQPGDTVKTVDLQVIGDALAEASEAFTITLQPPAGAGVTQGTATISVTDDDGTATLSLADVALHEGNSGTTTATFTASLSPASGQVVTVQYATSGGTATSDVDFVPTSGGLTFQPGETSKPISVPTTGDTAHEPDETFLVTLSNPTGGAVLGRPQATGVIQNDDRVVACTPRPRVVPSLAAGGGELRVRVEATPLNTQQNNTLQQMQFGTFQNALVTHNGQNVTSGQTLIIAPGTVFVDFTVQRVNAGQPTTVHLTVVDGCGAWPTFVGGGTSAGF